MDTMTIDRHLAEAMAQDDDCNGEDEAVLEKWRSISDSAVDSDDSPSSSFDCNICLESVQEPVVTLCGHLYCWPCIYKWLHYQSTSSENEDYNQQQRCPVCKAEVSQTTLVPLFCRGETGERSKSVSHNLGIMIPRRPIGFACGFDSPRSPIAANIRSQTSQAHHRSFPHESQLYHSQLGNYHTSPILSSDGTTTNAFNPVMGMFEEMIYGRVFGNSMSNTYAYPNSYPLAGSSSPRLRRVVMQADKSLSRICFFLFCCVFLCLLLF